MARQTKSLKKNNIVAIIVAFIVILSGIITISEKANIPFIPTWNEIFVKAHLANESVSNFDFKVTFLDVGQGDCEIIQSDGFVAMIDGGEAENADKIVKYLKNSNIEKLDYVFATHPHSDHIGAIPGVLEKIKCDNFVMSKMPDEIVPTTNVYKNLLTAVQKSGAKTHYSTLGEEIILGDCKLTVLGPVQQEKELNNTSLVILLNYENKKILFTGDMESDAELQMLDESTIDWNVDVLKAGHHGSRTATSQSLLDATTPKFAIVSCGARNTYGHPNDEFLKRAEDNNMTVYRTDLLGSITCRVEDNGLVFDFEKGA